MASKAWQLEEIPVGEGEEVPNSAADKLNQIIAMGGVVDLSLIEGYTEKIDDAATDGLAGTPGSLAYVLEENEHHVHCPERWLGKLAVQTATDWADNTLAPFRATSGNNTWGSDAGDAAQVLGTDDTPVIAGSAYYDAHRLMVVDASSQTIYKLRVIWGTGTMADAITAGQYSECVVQVLSAAARRGPIDLKMPRLALDTQLWVQAWNATDNATIDFLIGLHEYIG